MPADYSASALAWIALAVFLMGMNKGGFPVGTVALPILILMWPGRTDPARTAVSFMLPLLCVMDVIAIVFYRRRILWRRLTPLFPGMLVGVMAGSILFVSQESAVISFSDRWLKLTIGIIGLVFVVYRAMRRRILTHLADLDRPGWGMSSVFGMTAGLTSTLAHAAGPVLQMYLLPQKLPKLQFAGSTAAFFFILNLVKMAPFMALGRIQQVNLCLGAAMLPVIPLGVAAGYGLVRVMKPSQYVGFIYTILAITSGLLVVKALAG